MSDANVEEQPTSLYPSLYFQPTAPPEDSLYFTQANLENEKSMDYVEFQIDEHVARDKYASWVNGLWFTPTGFKKQATVPPFRKIYVPFFIFDVHAISSYKGQYLHKHFNYTTKCEEMYWKDAHGKREEHYSQLIYCADYEEQLRPMYSAVLSSILQRLSEDKSIQILSTMPSILASSMHEVRPSLDVEDVWNKMVKPVLESKEREKSENKLKTDVASVGYREIHVETEFNDRNSKLIWLPAFYGTYIYDNSHHAFVVNGRDGSHDGQRPGYGLGKIGDLKKGMYNFIGTVMHTHQSDMGLVHGSKLSTNDNSHVYDKAKYYMTFPRSNSYLITESIGYVTLRNKGGYPIELIAQKRRGAQRGASVTMEAGQEHTFCYKGHWCIEIAHGEPTDLEIIEWLGYDGQNKGDNRLGMA